MYVVMIIRSPSTSGRGRAVAMCLYEGRLSVHVNETWALVFADPITSVGQGGGRLQIKQVAATPQQSEVPIRQLDPQLADSGVKNLLNALTVTKNKSFFILLLRLRKVRTIDQL